MPRTRADQPDVKPPGDDRPKPEGDVTVVENARPVDQRFGGQIERTTDQDHLAERGLGSGTDIDPIPPRAKGGEGRDISGFPTRSQIAHDGDVVNPDKNNPNWMDPAKLPSPLPVNDPFLPGQALIAESPEFAPNTVANRPYGSEPQNFDPATGHVLPTPVKVRDSVEGQPN
jgi:hypothetical protein